VTARDRFLEAAEKELITVERREREFRKKEKARTSGGIAASGLRQTEKLTAAKLCCSAYRLGSGLSRRTTK
jgi:hypothetical protein